MRGTNIVAFISLIIFCMSCKNKESRTAESDRSLVLPQNITWTYYGKDTIVNLKQNYDYTLVKYVGKEYCIPCILGYQQMSKFVSNLNLRQSKVGFRLIFANMPVNKINNISQSEGIVDPICIDNNDEIIKMNPYLSNSDSCVVLLDKRGHTLVVGNPILNQSVGQVIAKIIWDKIPSIDSLSNAEISKRELYFGKCKIGNTMKAKLYINNISSNNLVIKEIKIANEQLRVVTQHLIKPHRNTVCNVQFRVKEKGYFCKDVVFMSNSKNPLHFKVSGIGIE